MLEVQNEGPSVSLSPILLSFDHGILADFCPQFKKLGFVRASCLTTSFFVSMGVGTHLKR